MLEPSWFDEEAASCCKQEVMSCMRTLFAQVSSIASLSQIHATEASWELIRCIRECVVVFPKNERTSRVKHSPEAWPYFAPETYALSQSVSYGVSSQTARFKSEASIHSTSHGYQMAPKQTSPAPIAPRRQLQSHHLTVAQHLHQDCMILILLHHVGNLS